MRHIYLATMAITTNTFTIVTLSTQSYEETHAPETVAALYKQDGDRPRKEVYLLLRQEKTHAHTITAAG